MTEPARRPMVNSYDPLHGDPDPSDADLLRRRESTLGPIAALFYRRPVRVDHGRGAHLYGPDGTDYLDCYNNVACVGHAHPAVTAAVSEQMARVNTHTRYLNDRPVELAERLLATFPAGLDRVIFTNSGSESNDLALRIARVATGHSGVIVTANAYHGTTDLVSSVSPSFGTGVANRPYLRTIEVNDVLTTPAEGAVAILSERTETAARELEEAGYGVGAFLADQILSSDGILPHPRGWLARLAEITHAHGGLVIADEVQSGFGRTGEAMWGFQRHGVDADVVTLGKPMANGIPAGAVVVRHHLADLFSRYTRYFNTFGGNPVSMEAARAVLDVIEEEGLLVHARSTGEAIAAGLRAGIGGRGRVGAIRSAGLFIGVDILTPEGAPDGPRAMDIVAAFRDANVLISATGPAGNTLKIRPPLVFTGGDTERLLRTTGDIADRGLFD